jgi:hypothetical protein
MHLCVFTLSQLHSCLIFYSKQSRHTICGQFKAMCLHCAVTALVATFPMPSADVSLMLQQWCNVQAHFQNLSLLSLTTNHICREHRTHNPTHKQPNCIHCHYVILQQVAATCSFARQSNATQSTNSLHAATDSCQIE